MDLIRVQRLLRAATEQRHGCLRIAGREHDSEIRWLVAAGLVEATLSDDSAAAFTSIDRVTETGYAFLRTFEKPPTLATLLPASARRAAEPSTTGAGLLEKWKVNFALGLRRPPKP